MNATVKWFDPKKGYGFLTTEDGKDVFVHNTSIQMDGFRHLEADDIVSFELGTGNNGREQAVNVVPILTMKMIKNSLKKEKMYVRKMKDPHTVCRLYVAVDGNNEIMSSEQGMTVLELAEFAGFSVDEKTE